MTLHNLAQRSTRAIPAKDDIHTLLAELRSEQADDIRQFVEAILQASFEKKGVPVLHEEPFETSLLEAIHNIGQVNFKSPDAQVTTLPMWGEASSAATYDAIADSCDDVDILHRLVFGGNAVYLGYAKFLTAAYRLDGHVQCVLLSIVDDDAVAAALRALGMRRELQQQVRQQVEQARAASWAQEPIHPLSKQIFWEAEGQPPVLLVPVASDRLVGEIHRRLKAQGDHYIPNQIRINVGGTKPGNAGKVYSEMGGVSLLMALPPPPLPYQEKLLRRLQQQGTVFGSDSVAYKVLDIVLKACSDTPKVSSLIERQREQAAYRVLADAVLLPARTLMEQHPDLDFSAFPQRYPSVLRWLADGVCSESDADSIVPHIFDKTALVGGDHPYAPWRERLKSKEVIDRLQSCLISELCCFGEPLCS